MTIRLSYNISQEPGVRLRRIAWFGRAERGAERVSEVAFFVRLGVAEEEGDDVVIVLSCGGRHGGVVAVGDLVVQTCGYDFGLGCRIGGLVKVRQQKIVGRSI